MEAINIKKFSQLGARQAIITRFVVAVEEKVKEEEEKVKVKEVIHTGHTVGTE